VTVTVGAGSSATASFVLTPSSLPQPVTVILRKTERNNANFLFILLASPFGIEGNLLLKKCTKCKRSKRKSSFPIAKSNRDGRSSWCKECSYAYRREWAILNADRVKNSAKDHAFRHRYGITTEDYEKMFKKQRGLCKLCRKPEMSTRRKYLSVDHCHQTGRVRGLLCARCNMVVGVVEADNSLERIVAYLRNT
jgi:Autographiviridae endonuclease VII